MRAGLCTVLAATMAASSGGTAVAWPALAAARTVDESPEKLYKEGKKAYRLGRYGEAVKKFERAYDLSDNALLLYNIGLAYKNWYSVSKDTGHLRKARAVFQNFYLETQRDPNVGDPAEAEQEIKEVEELLAKAEEEERERDAAAAARDDAKAERDTQRPTGPTGPDPGKKLRLGGIIGMGVGGALVLTGAVLGVVYGLRGQEFRDDLQNLYGDRDDMNCQSGSTSGDCPDILADIETTRDNGRKANLLVAISLGVVGGIGVAGFATGGVLFIFGMKRTKAWREGKAAHLRLVPTPGGLGLRGRF